MKTPYTESGLRQFDHLPVEEAILRAWNETGPNSGWHMAGRKQVRDAMPLLARALDRLTAEVIEGGRPSTWGASET